MSVRPDLIGPVPEETVRVAQAVFRKGNLCLRLREALGTIYEDELFADLFSPTGRPAEAPWRLALVCVLQYVEDLSDRQAAEAVRASLDWKYLLGLELTDPGFDFSVLSEFRDRLLKQEAGSRIFERLVQRLSDGGWIKKRGVQRTDSTHVLAAVRRLHRVELLGEMLRATLTRLAEHAPDWLTGWVPLEWFERYSRRIEEWRLPSAKDKQEAVMEQIGQDGSRLRKELWSEQAPASLRALPQVEGLRKTWTQQFLRAAKECCGWATGNPFPGGESTRLTSHPLFWLAQNGLVPCLHRRRYQSDPLGRVSAREEGSENARLALRCLRSR